MRTKYITAVIALFALSFTACKDETKEILLPYPNDYNFEDQVVDRLNYRIPDAPFQTSNGKSGSVTVNVKKNQDGTFSGFAVSNKAMRSYPWSLSPTFGPVTLTPQQKKAAIDSTIFSMYSVPAPSQTGTYLVGNAIGSDANISWETPAVVEHVLAANNTYNYLLANYGSVFSGTLNAATQVYERTGSPVRNPNNPNTSAAMFGVFYIPGPNNEDAIRLAGQQILGKRNAGKIAADAARAANKTPQEVTADSTAAAVAYVKGDIKLIITGMNGSKETGKVEFYLATLPNVDPQNPAYDFIMSSWNRVDLSSLGAVNKLVFNVTSSSPSIAPYFCIDGLRLKQ